ncbi:acyltransferase family protein [Spirosoma aerophilum]
MKAIQSNVLNIGQEPSTLVQTPFTESTHDGSILPLPFITSQSLSDPFPQSAPSLSTQSDRFHALDAVRAFALILGVFFHGSLSFVSYIGYFWAVRDSQPSVFMDGFFYLSHTFRMQAFFVIAGYFAHFIYHRQGAKGFFTHRVRRILLPFLLFMPLIYMLAVTLWVWGQQRMGIFFPNTPMAKIAPWLIMKDNVLTLKWFNTNVTTVHLWFLYVLMIFCLTVSVTRPLFIKLDRSHRIRIALDKGLAKLARNSWGGVALGLILVLPMFNGPSWVGVEAMKGVIPVLSGLGTYGLFFTVGWFFHRQPALITELKRFWKLNLAISIVLLGGLTFFLLRLTYLQAAPPNLPAIDPKIVSGFLPVTNVIYAVGSMTAVFAFIGVILQYFDTPSKRIRYLSDSAYWIYLAHLPIVVFFQILVAPLQLHWLLKMPLIFVPTFAILFLTYHFGVRNTWLGTLLNGRRYPLK